MSHFTLKIQHFKVLGFALCLFLPLVFPTDSRYVRNASCSLLCLGTGWSSFVPCSGIILSGQEHPWALWQKYLSWQLMTQQGRMRLNRKNKLALFRKLLPDSLRKCKLEVMHDVQGTNLPVSALLLDFYLCRASEAKNYIQIKYQGDNLKLFSLLAELLYVT